MSTRFFSNRDVEHDAPFEPLERQQALLLAALRKAGGAPVSYAELRDAGIEFPASVVSELELAGVSIERLDGSRRAVGVRLDPTRDNPAISSDLSAPAADWRTRRWFAPAATLAAVAAVLSLAIVALTAGGGAGHGSGARAHTRSSAFTAIAHARTPAAAHSQSSSPSPSTSPPAARPAAQPNPTPVSATLAAQLEAQGHQLLADGRYANAVPVLERALAATGQSLGACVQPANEPCLTYAYALYDLGRALLLSGAPAAAVGVLEHRLQIENQQPVVAAELASARRQLG